MRAITAPCVVTVNGGSSSIRCAVYETAGDANINLLAHVKIDRIGQPDATFTITDTAGTSTRVIDATDRDKAIAQLLDWLGVQSFFSSISAIGHRVVHGMSHSQPQRITPQLLKELQTFSSVDPEHLPFEIELIAAFQQQFHIIPHIACFDTAFHHQMPEVARTLPLPERYRKLGIERYGFHGLSYSYLMQELARIDRDTANHRRIVIAHLGNGASLAAIKDGICIDTSMSFTPASGIMMSTRSGDIDPGVLYYLSKSRQLTVDDLQRLLNHGAGMKGVSGISGDVRELLRHEHTNAHAALALAMFCYQIKKYIGAYAVALGGLDTLIFAGGIGENSPAIRERICDGLEFIGVALNVKANHDNKALISRDAGKVRVRVMHTDEEMMIATSIMQMLNPSGVIQS